MSEAQYFILQDEQQFGPYSSDELRAYVADGSIRRQSMFWMDGEPEWKPISTLKGIFTSPPPVPKKPPALPAARVKVSQNVPLESPCSRGIYITLGILVGSLGIHNFYAGRIKQGAWQGFLSLAFCWTFVAPIIVWLWAFMDIANVRTDGEGRLFQFAGPEEEKRPTSPILIVILIAIWIVILFFVIQFFLNS